MEGFDDLEELVHTRVSSPSPVMDQFFALAILQKIHFWELEQYNRGRLFNWPQQLPKEQHYYSPKLFDLLVNELKLCEHYSAPAYLNPVAYYYTREEQERLIKLIETNFRFRNSRI